MRIKTYKDLLKVHRSLVIDNVIKLSPSFIGTLFKRIPQEYELTVFMYTTEPQLARISYFFISQAVARLNQSGIKTKILIVDCSGTLSSAHFAEAIVQRFPNLSHHFKLDYFTLRYIRSRLVWIMHDDAFVLDPQAAIEAVNAFNSDPNLAAFSFRPREWWHFELAGARVKPMSTYCLMVKPEILKKEKLSFYSGGGPNPRSGRAHDDGDILNLRLLEKGYTVKILDEPRWFSHLGSGSAKALLAMCSKDELIEYLSSPFSYGNHFLINMASFYALVRMNEVYHRLFGEYYPVMFTEPDLRAFLERVTKQQVKERALTRFAEVDGVVNNILERLNKGTDHP